VVVIFRIQRHGSTELPMRYVETDLRSKQGIGRQGR
jgi:hypothetical protein